MLAYTFYESDSRVMRYVQTLVRRGDHVDIIALRQEGQSSSAVVDGARVYRIQKDEKGGRARFHYIVRILLFLFKAMFLLAKNQVKHRYDLIHVHSVPDCLVFAAWFPKFSGSKIILDIHDLLPEFYQSKFTSRPTSAAFRLLVAVERMSAAFSHHVIVANHIWRQTLVTRSVPDDKCTAILNFPDRALLLRRGRERTNHTFIILYPGTLNHHQGVDLAIRAFARIKDEAPSAEFHIYGFGDTKPYLAELITKLGLEARVFLRNLLPYTEISAIMENSDLGVVPKRKDSFGNEAFSTKILEFMSLGVPVIVSDTKVDRYYFNDSLVKFFRGGDEEDLAHCMLLMIRDKALRQRLTKNSEEFIKENTWEIKQSLYLGIIDSLLATRVVPSRITPPFAGNDVRRAKAKTP